MLDLLKRIESALVSCSTVHMNMVGPNDRGRVQHYDETLCSEALAAVRAEIASLENVTAAFKDINPGNVMAVPSASALERICDETYQVVGSLSSDLGVFDRPEVQHVLDNLSRHRLVHNDILPFPSFKETT